MITVVAIDDEPLALELIETYCKRIDTIASFISFTKTNLALKYLKDNTPTVILLDINMPAISGLEFYNQLQIKPKLIFTTSYSEYAVEGFDVGAIDYLLKPFSFERFYKAIQRVLNSPSLQQSNSMQNDFLMLRLDYALVKVVLTEITFVEALDNYLRINIENKPAIVVRMTLKALLDKLPKNNFIKVHRSFIVSLRHVQGIKQKKVMINNEAISISKNYENELRQKLAITLKK